MGHTPGPWFRDQYGHVYGWTEETRIERGTEKNSVVLVDGRTSKATSADKNLIAAAPELLASCEQLLRMCVGYAVSAGDDSLITKEAFATARAAIAKAGGQS